MDTVLLTGSAGFIGMHITLKLLKEGYRVISIDNINDYYNVGLKYARLSQLGIQKDDILYNQKIDGLENFSFVQMALEDAGNLNNLFAKEKIDYVVHLAAQAGVRYSITNPRNYIDSNIIGFYNILEACRYYPVKHLVFASSSSVYGLNKKVPFHESDHTSHPVSLYAATKKANEVIGHSYSQLYKIPMTGLRFFTVYGPWGRPDMAPFKFTKAILEEETIQVYNHGDMQRDFTYVTDIVEGVYLSLTNIPDTKTYDHLNIDPSGSSAPYQLFNIGNSKPVHLMDFIKAIEESTGKKALMKFMPMQLGDVQTTYASTENLNDSTGYSPSTSIKDGIDSFVQWYKEYYSIT